MTYDDVINEALSDYPKTDWMNKVGSGVKIPDIIVQYKETDWEFIKRLASHFNAPVVADEKESYPRFTFEQPQTSSGNETKELTTLTTKNFEDYLDKVVNFPVEMSDLDEINYRITE